MKKIYLVKNRYVDSVSLMGVAEKILRYDGVAGAESGMGTPANTEMLAGLGYQIPKGTSKNDLMIAVDADTLEHMEAACQAGMDILEHRGARQPHVYHDLSELPSGQYDIAQISLPGEYAAGEIKKALNLGMDVFAFSDNVSLEEERECKELGRKKGLLVMGPDAGVGLIGGVALAAGSIVRHGGVGVVGASGSGAQEVACLIERLGAGVSAIIGTGGRDLRPEIGGITMLMGMERLDKDPDTQVICLVSKLADLSVMARVLSAADKLVKPVVAVFLGSDEKLFEGRRVHGTFSLEAAAEKSYALLTGESKTIGWTDDQLKEVVRAQMARVAPERRYFRGLYCGGTFTEEALILFARENPGVKLYSNLNTPYAERLKSHHESMGHAILDLGSEEFTAEAPHPIFDPSLRLRRLEKELEDREVAVVLLDFITGPGMHCNPVMPFVPLIQRHREIVFIAAICGAEGDPQDIGAARQALKTAGCVAADSNYQSARLAAAMMAALDGRR